MKRIQLSIGYSLFVGLTLCALRVPAQNDGDQIVDGIGETALVARYMFSGNAQDRSRNSHNGTLRGSGATFVEDSRFGQVLSLPGGRGGGYVELPGDVLTDVDTVSVVGWVFLRSTAADQRFFDFGQNASLNFYCTPIGGSAADGYRARITSGGRSAEAGPVAPRVPTDGWVHLAVVLNSTRQTITTYVNGVRAGHAIDVPLNTEHVLHQQSAAANHLYLGRSQSNDDPGLDAKLHDVRIYSIALNDQQVTAIFNNARSGNQSVAARATAGAGDSAAAPKESPIASVSDVTVETVQGYLPQLPAYVEGKNRDGSPAKVRVIWPSPTDNSQVLEPGTYTVTGKVAGTSLEPKATVTVKRAAAAPPAPRRTVEAFPLGQVVLNQDAKQQDTQFIKNRDKFVRGLAESNPDRFLYNFRHAFGQPQPEGARPLGSWDGETTRLRGHGTGHYLSAIAQCYASATYDPALQSNFLQKMNYMIDTLYDLSQKSGKPAKPGGEFNADPLTVPMGPGKSSYDSDLRTPTNPAPGMEITGTNGIRTDYWNWGKGFISGYPPDQFIMLEKGATYGSRNNQIWAPYYTLHKILAGLLDCYEVGGNQKALQIAQDMGLWVHARLSALPTATRISMWNRYIAGEYGGMNEVMARLARLTGDRRFLECAQLFDNINFFYGNAERTHGLAKNVDTLRGKHANQHIPQITGALETYRGTGDLVYYHIADYFWDICNQGYTYSIGGVAGAKNPNNSECFTAQPNTLFANGFNNGGQNETCATYNLLKLSRQLFMFDQDAKYMDYYEQSLYNHILASVAENNPGNTYHVPLNPGARKGFGNANMTGFTCCNGTAIESSTKLQDSIYFRSANNDALYVNLYVPSILTWKERNVVVKQHTSFPYEDTTRLTLTGGGAFDLKVRVPAWATKGFHVKINGQEQRVDAKPGTYLTLHRTWKDKDTVELRMPFDFHLNPVMDRPDIASIFYGPVLLAAEEPAARSDWRPVTLDAKDISKSITGDPATLRFNIGDASLKPFYEMYGRHSVYLSVTLK